MLLEEVCDEYPRAVPFKCMREEGLLTRDHVKNVLKSVVKDSSPGLPLAELARTNKELIEKHFELIYNLVLIRIENLSKVKLPDDPVELVAGGFCDPIRIFVKNESTRVAKIVEGRSRLIWSVSLIDQIVERLLFSPQNEAEISNWKSCPSKPGVGFSTDEQRREFWEYMVAKLAARAESDVIGWDWNVKKWMMLLEAEMRIRLSGEPIDGYFARLVRNRFHCLINSLIVLSDGRMFTKKGGILPSGSYITSSSGSRMRRTFAKWIGAKTSDSMGDDCNEDFVEDAMEKYASRGLPLKGYKKCYGDGEEPHFEFCSHYFSEKLCYPQNIVKSFHHLMVNPVLEERDEQFKWLFRGHPSFDKFGSVLRAVREGPRKHVL